MKKFLILTFVACSILCCTKQDSESANETPDPTPEMPEPEPEKYIVFEDYTVKELCISMWDANGDGKLSETEAAAVKSIGGVFSGKKIYNFDELRFFTGITEIQAGAFQYKEETTSRYYTYLQRITIPKNVKRIGEDAFYIDNTNGGEITVLPSTPPTIIGDEIVPFWVNKAQYKIYVPWASVEAYKSKWDDYARCIYGRGL